ncbi:MAG: glycosyltransferase, partial [Inquilinus sp.]|nr:glycosyltransferase [Inquilinus sp.]
AHDRARRPLVASSVRDILVAKEDPAKEAWMAETARRWFDLVLVHGDPALIPFDATFPPAAGLADLIRYTGYVVPPPRSVAGNLSEGTGEVIVSTGGGVVGAELLRAALAARPLCGLAEAPWRFLLGPDLPAAVAAELHAAAGPGIVVEPARPDFPALLAHCRLSISQAGYNTAMDVLAAGCRAILAPFEADGETEQAVRAGLLAARGLVQSIPAARLDGPTLAAAVDAAIETSPPPLSDLRRDGAAATARLLKEALQTRMAKDGGTDDH